MMIYSAMKKICEQKEVAFVDVFHPSIKLYADADESLTMNGIHLLSRGNQKIAQVMISELFGRQVD